MLRVTLYKIILWEYCFYSRERSAVAAETMDAHNAVILKETPPLFFNKMNNLKFTSKEK